MDKDEARLIIEDVLDTLVEVGNGVSDEMLHEAAGKLFRFRNEFLWKLDIYKEVKMQEFEIWSEGYVVTGDEGQAHYHGTVLAETFKKACIFLFDNDEHKKFFDPERMTHWGCRLFDNEADARKAFG